MITAIIAGIVSTVVGGWILLRMKKESASKAVPVGNISVADSPGSQTVVGNNNEVSQIFNQGPLITVNGRRGEPDYRRSPTPKDIAEAVEDVPVFSRPDILKTFLNIAVDWDAEFRLIKKDPFNSDPDIYVIALADPKSERFSIYCSGVSVETFPMLKRLKYGHSLRVCGVISDVDGLGITLKNAEFVIPENVARKK